MRASCETDLARQFPLAVMAKWLGTTQVVASDHIVSARGDVMAESTKPLA